MTFFKATGALELLELQLRFIAELQGLYALPLLWEKLQGLLCRMASDGGQADEGEASAVEAGVAPEDA